MATSNHYAIILHALERLADASDHETPVATVRAIRDEAVRLGLVTRDRRGAGHRVRSALQCLRDRGRVVYLGPDQWGLPLGVDELCALGRGPAPAAETLRDDLAALDTTARLLAVVRGEKPTHVLFADAP